MNFALIASISAFWAEAGAVNEITNAITSAAMLRMIISTSLNDADADAAVVWSRVGCVECPHPRPGLAERQFRGITVSSIDEPERRAPWPTEFGGANFPGKS